MTDLSQESIYAYNLYLRQADCLEQRVYKFYVNYPQVAVHDTEYWHSVGVRLGES